MAEPILLSSLKKKTGSLGMWKQCICEIHTNYILLKQGIYEPIVNRIDFDGKFEMRKVKSNIPNQFVISDARCSYHLQAENDNSLQNLFGAIRSIQFSKKPMAIEDFTILSTLGRGHFGKVLLVEHKETHDIFAIKAIKKQHILNEHKLHTIFAERNILMMSHHPFIVTMYFAFQNSKKFYIGLEYVPGGALFRFLQIGRVMKLKEVRFYVAEVALALDYLHSKGVLYRDLKLENVLLCEDGHIKLTDFGLSKTLVQENGEYHETSTFCGTNEYLPPEMIADKEYGYEIDWWTLGVFTYEFLFSETPFYDKNLKKMYNNILTKQPTFPKDAPAVVKDFILKLLNKDPQQRAGFHEIKHHPFFANINWDDVYNKKLVPPYLPKVVTGRRATNFSEKNRKDRKDSDAPSVSNLDEFDGFSYIGGEF